MYTQLTATCFMCDLKDYINTYPLNPSEEHKHLRRKELIGEGWHIGVTKDKRYDLCGGCNVRQRIDVAFHCDFRISLYAHNRMHG